MFMTFCFFIISVGFWPIVIIPCFLSWRPFTSREPRKSTTLSFPSRKYTYKCHWWLGDHHVAALHGINAVSVDSIAWEWIWNMLLDSAQSARRTANYLASTGRATFTSITASPSVCNPPLPLQSLSRCLSVAPEEQLSHSGPHALSWWLFLWLALPNLCHLIDLSTTPHLPHHHVTMNFEAHSDIDRWLRFLLPWSRHAIIPDPHGTRAPNLELFTDASGSIGYGIFYAGHWTADP